MDPSHWTTPKRLAFSQTGKYLIDLPAELPIRLYFYDFSLPHPSIPNYHDHLEINYIYKGSGTFTIGGKGYPAEPGDIFVVNAGDFHLLEASRPEHFGTLGLYFMPELVLQPETSGPDLEYLALFLGERQRFCPRVSLSPESSRTMLQLIDGISEELWGQRKFYRIAVKTLLCQVLLTLNRAAKASRGGVGELRFRQLHTAFMPSILPDPDSGAWLRSLDRGR